MLTNTSKWSHARGNEVVPSPWQMTNPHAGSNELPQASGSPPRFVSCYDVARLPVALPFYDASLGRP